MNSLQLITHECIKGSTTVDKVDIETFVITEGNRTQTAPLDYTQKVSILSAVCFTPQSLVESVA
jgi:hypothetical protein